jgi:hypothetical protein
MASVRRSGNASVTDGAKMTTGHWREVGNDR